MALGANDILHDSASSHGNPTRTETMTSIERVKKLFPKTLSCLARHVGNWLYQFEAHSVHPGSPKSYHGTESLRMFTPVFFWRTLFPKFPKTHKFGRPAVPCCIPSSLGWSIWLLRPLQIVAVIVHRIKHKPISTGWEPCG